MAAVVRGADSQAFRGGVRLVIARTVAQRAPRSRRFRPSAMKRRAIISFPDATGRSRAGPGIRDESCVADPRIEAPFRSRAAIEGAHAFVPAGGPEAAALPAVPRSCRASFVSGARTATAPTRVLAWGQKNYGGGLLVRACCLTHACRRWPRVTPSGDDRALWHRPWSEMMPGHGRVGSATIRPCRQRRSERCELRGVRSRVRVWVARLFRARWPV